MHRLLTIRISHFNEKARWALDWCQVPYRELGFMPMVHMPAVAVASLKYGPGHRDRISSRLSTPYLICDDGRSIADSSAICRYASDRFGQGRLYPTSEVGELETWFHDTLGPHTRRLAYFHLFRNPHLIPAVASRNVGRAQALLTRALLPAAVPMMTRSMRISPSTAERSAAVVREVFQEVENKLAGRSFLVGEGFTAADLSFASLAAPVLLPSQREGYGAYLPPLSSLPADYRALAEELRESDAGRFALRMFTEHRQPSPAVR